MSQRSCNSCTMPLESGDLCHYCADEAGALRPFEEVFERMLQWTQRHEPGLDRAEAERRTRSFMRERPAWRDHPALRVP